MRNNIDGRVVAAEEKTSRDRGKKLRRLERKRKGLREKETSPIMNADSSIPVRACVCVCVHIQREREREKRASVSTDDSISLILIKYP